SVMGGVLDVAGVEGFLGNLDALYAHADGDAAAWREFTQVWWDIHGATPVHVSVLLALCEGGVLLPHVLRDGTPRAQQTRLGRALRGIRDRTFGQLQVIVGGADRDSRTLYSLRQTDDGPESAATDPQRNESISNESAIEGSNTTGPHWYPYEDD